MVAKPKIAPRSYWTNQTSQARSGYQTVSSRSVLYVHYTDGPGRWIVTPRQRRRHMRALRDMHAREFDGDIGYHFIVFQPWLSVGKAKIYEGRPLSRVPAAQKHYNVGNVAVCVVASPNETIMKRTITAIQDLYRWLPCQKVKGHRDVNSTDCPGDKLYSKLSQIRRVK